MKIYAKNTAGIQACYTALHSGDDGTRKLIVGEPELILEAGKDIQIESY